MSPADRRRLDRLIRKASAVLGRPLDRVRVVGERRMGAKLSSVMDNESQPMKDTVSALSSSGDRLLHALTVPQLLPSCCRETIQPALL